MTEPYEIIARKYRPMIFEEMVGQKTVVQTLRNAVAHGRIAQAYLFSGMRGVGKTSAARILAKALNCQSGPTATPCNQCEFCRAINEDRLTDVLEIDGASNTGVDDVRQLREGLRYKSLQARYKVIIIDEVHMLSKAAFNALLKTLEEPPAKTVFIFATTEFNKVPATIVSRCQHFEFKKISYRDLINHLVVIAKKEDISLSDEGAAMIAEAAEGSLRDAQSLLDQAVAFSGAEVKDADLKEILGVVSRELLLEFSGAVLGRRPQDIFPLVEKIIELGYEPRSFAKKLVRHFRDLLLVRTVDAPGEGPSLSPDDISRLREEAGKASPEELLRCLIALQNGEAVMRYSSHPQIHLESLLIKLCHFKDLVPLSELLRDIEGAKAAPASAAGPAFRAPAASSSPSGRPPGATLRPQERISASPPAPDPSVRTTSPQDLLPATIERLRAQKSSLAALLAKAESAAVKSEPLDIKFSTDKRFSVQSPVTLEVVFGADMRHTVEAVQAEARQIEKAAAEASGLRVRLKVVLPENHASAARQGDADLALKDAGVRKFVDTFKAQVLSVEKTKDRRKDG
ncbi:MAG: DNA polymerase III subunit gamma/tau [Candidatus Aminicenantes bacterium]|nr:DNA polymerase III subunit gamma/tau [Candidatus Aminicenantes bacterium]